MGLRIGTNMGALTALRSLNRLTPQEIQTFERLSTGRSINRASDNPSGLVLLEQLTSQIGITEAATEGIQRGMNLINVADAALGEIADLAIQVQSNAVASMGPISDSQRQALQGSTDQALAAISRIASTTRFGDQPLLNGNMGFQFTNIAPELERVNVQTINGGIPFPMTANVSVTAAATQAQAAGTIAAAQPTGGTFRIQGNLGTEDVTLQPGATQADVITAINSVSETTGVVAVDSGPDVGKIRSAQVGSDQFARVEFLSGEITGITEGMTFGTDIVGAVDGAAVTGRGNTINVQTGRFTGEITVEQGVTGTFSFTVGGGGLRLQTGPSALDSLVVGVGPAGPQFLGTTSGLGSLSNLQTGGSASFQNGPGDALGIARSALNEVSTQRAGLGAVSGQLLESQRDALDVQTENLKKSRSMLGDTDFAREVTSMVRNRILRESGLGVLRSSMLAPGSVLKLLGR